MLAQVGFLHIRNPQLARSKAHSRCKQNSTISFFTLIPSLPTPASISCSYNFKTSTGWNPIITVLSLYMTIPLQSAFSYPICSALNAMPAVAIAFLFSKRTPHNHLTIIRSVLSNLAISSIYIVQVSLAYPKTLWIRDMYSFPFTLRSSPWC